MILSMACNSSRVTVLHNNLKKRENKKDTGRNVKTHLKAIKEEEEFGIAGSRVLSTRNPNYALNQFPLRLGLAPRSLCHLNRSLLAFGFPQFPLRPEHGCPEGALLSHFSSYLEASPLRRRFAHCSLPHHATSPSFGPHQLNPTRAPCPMRVAPLKPAPPRGIVATKKEYALYHKQKPIIC